MDLKERVRISVSKRPGAVVLRRDLEPLGGRTQLTQVLSELQRDGVLTRFGEGVYGKAQPDHPTTSESIRELALEILRKVEIPVERCEVTAREVVVRVAGESRHARHLEIQGRPFRFQRAPRFEAKVPTNIRDLPTRDVADYVRQLAAAHRVSYQRTSLDAWAEGVTRAAGDSAYTDGTDGLLIRLKQRKILNDDQFSQLIVNHFREAKRV